MDTRKKWIFGTLIIGLYGCLKKISPESTYIAQFYSGPRFNFTKEQVDREIYPITTYSNTVAVLIVVLVTDYLRYKPVLVLGAIAFLIQKSLLVWGTSLFQIQTSQFFLGLNKACGVAYKTYIYCITEKENYQIGTAVTRVANKFGFIFSSVLGQAGKSFFNCTTEDLNMISFIVSIMGLACALFLPFPKKRIYFNKEDSSGEEGENKQDKRQNLCFRAFGNIWKDLKEAYTNPYVVKWSLWWVLAKGGYRQVTSFYVQRLWNEISGGEENKYNAGVETITTVSAILLSSVVGATKVNWKVYGDAALAVCTLLEGGLILLNANTSSLTISYTLYVAFILLYDVSMLISNSEVAKQLKSERFALIFGANTFLGFCFHFILTELIVTKHGFALKIRNQFRFMGCVFLALGMGYALKSLVNLFRKESEEGTDKAKNGEIMVDVRSENTNCDNSTYLYKRWQANP